MVYSSTQFPNQIRLACLTVGIALTACTCLTACTQEEDKAHTPPTPLVQTEAIHEEALAVQWTFMGEVSSDARAQMSAGADGELVRILVQEGNPVKKGQLLAVVDSKVVSAQLQASEAAVKQAEVQQQQALSEAERFSKAGSRLVTGLEIERARAEAAAKQAQQQSLNAQQQQVRAQLARHQVRAPFDGIISQRFADQGDWLTVGTPIVEIVSEKSPDILVRAGAEMLDFVHRGNKATIARQDEQVSATVKGVVRALDPGTRTVTFRLVPDESPAWLLVGSTCDVKFSADVQRPGALVVPRDAVVPSAIADRVFKIKKNKAIAISVEVLYRADEDVLLRAENLRKGDNVVVRGNERLRPGQTVKVSSTH